MRVPTIDLWGSQKKVYSPGSSNVKVNFDAGGSTAEGMPLRLSLGELFRITYTRDTWRHRVDIVCAVGRPLALDPAVDGRIIEDVVKEWADRHGESFSLTLTGPAGGRWERRGGGLDLEVDAVEFCWILSGRGTSEHALLAHRLVF